MKCFPSLFLANVVLLLPSPVSSSKSSVNPVSKVLDMISKLQQGIIKEGAEEQVLYTEFAEMCSDRSRELHQEGKTSRAKVAESSASIEKNKADTALLEEKVNSAAAGIDDADNEVKKAAEIRGKEAIDFKAEQKSLLTMISALERSITIVEHGNKDGASLAQVQQDRMEGIASVFEAMVEASAFNSYDQEKLTALVQTSAANDADENQVGAPSAAAYTSQSGGVVETLGGLLEKAQKELEDIRQAESRSAQSFEMQRQALAEKGKTLTKELGESKKGLAQTAENQATSEGDLEGSKKELAEGVKELHELHGECLDKANSFEESAKARSEELKALGEAAKIISESSGGATKQTYGLVQTSFLQVASQEESSGSKSTDALHVVRRLALSHRSKALGKLASSIEKSIKASTGDGSDIFGKVKGLIESMIDQLQSEATAEATKKTYCDKEMSETQANMDDKDDTIERLTIRIDVMSSNSKKLKGDIFRLNKELAELMKSQQELDKLRTDEKAIYDKNLPQMEQGLEGIKTALKVLRDYYANDETSSGGGAGSGIIGMLQVVESDFSKGIAASRSEEESAVSEYKAATQENRVAKATKEKDVKFKTKSTASLEKSIVDSRTDRAGSQEELAAVKEYWKSIEKECIAKVDSYEKRTKKRAEEVAGLKDALKTLSSDPGERLEMLSSFFQEEMLQKTLRGATVRVHQA